MSSAQAKARGQEKGAALFADRRFAAGVMALIILIFTPIGARMSLDRAVDNVEEQFFTGAGGRGAVADFLGDAEDAAMGLVTVGAGYGEAQAETAGLRADRELFLDALDSGDIPQIAAANAALTGSFNALRDKLLALGVTGRDAEDLEYYGQQFDGAQGAVHHAGYNEAAAEFIADTYDRFPANVIGSVLGVDPPELFQED